MDEEIKVLIDEFLDINQKIEYHFRKLYGLTFVFKREISLIKNHLTSAEVKPLGIIYEENDEYYFAPLCEVDNLDEIIREYVKHIT